MKRNFVSGLKGIFILLLLAALFVNEANSQVVNERARKRISIGVGMFTDIWSGIPDGIAIRAINQGFQSFVMYNAPFGKSNFGFSAGLGFRANNMYGNFLSDSLRDPSGTGTELTMIPKNIDFKRSKLTTPYLELPLEFRYTSKSKIGVGIGFKLAYLLPAHTKYVGEDYLLDSESKLRVKYREIENLESFSYGPTLHIGYKWFHVTGYYSISKLFVKNKGPQMYPISIGFVLMPY